MIGPQPLFGPGPLTPLYRSECGMGGSGGLINHNLGPSGWGNGGAGLYPGYDIGRPVNQYEEAFRFSPPPVAPPPIVSMVLPKVFEPEPLVDLSWRTDLLPGCGDEPVEVSPVFIFDDSGILRSY